MRRNNTWPAVIALLMVVALVVLGNIMVIGDHLARIPHFGWLSWVFYGLLAVLFVWALVLPALRLHFSPELPALSVDGAAGVGELRKFGATLLANSRYIPDRQLRKKHVSEMERRLSMAGSDKEKLREVIDAEVAARIDGDEEYGVPGINRRIDLWAQRVLVTTAISQNSKLDSLIVLWTNYKMVSDIACASGFRPNSRQLVKLYINVVATAFFSYALSEGLSGMDDVHPFEAVGDNPEDMVDIDADDSEGGFTLMGILRKIKLPGIAVESLLDGATNALLTYRIGYITRAYIIEGHERFAGKDNKRKIRREAIRESFRSMPRAIKNGSSQMTSTATSLLSSLYKNL